MDEPTNDLDIETIELLEERLLEYSGTLLLVSHDRDFHDNVVTATIALDGKGGVQEYSGGCEDWLEKMIRPKEKAKPLHLSREKTEPEAPKKRKLLNKEREALKKLPKQIEHMEADRDQITASMQEPDYYRNAENDPLGDQQKLEELENKILEAYAQWEELDGVSQND